MNLDDFDYPLPPERIAQQPVEPRDSSRLLVVHRASGMLEHRVFRDLADYLRPGDALVLNQTRVIPARLHARKIPSGGLVEILLVERIDPVHWLGMVGGKRIGPGMRLALDTGDSPLQISAEVLEARHESERVLRFSEPLEPHFEVIGQMPLPPYIHETLPDPERYQTVYGREPGSVAAPTAGLHFTPDLLMALRAMGVNLVFCTLHVGPGTFQPVKVQQIAAHKLHQEYAELTGDAARMLNDTRLRGGRIVAVGTTTVRTLETSARKALGEAGIDPDTEACPWRPLTAFAEPTDLFITPGYRFRVVDAMVTNFHLPRSTLLMLVSAFAGRDLILRAYDEAIREGYRFYSLGDAMVLV